MTRPELPLYCRTVTVTAYEEDGGEIPVQAELRDERRGRSRRGTSRTPSAR
ncbi:hypothetical protein ABTY98_33920 [Streptomyces sp. NPDC096040]|uniref:hypothetical protein n=1 Tax=Streptomyces sp. NPDC096040 TaxID=3155541 RepID=UPI0033312549